MTNKALMSPRDAVAHIAKLYETATDCTLAVREDRVFGDNWLPLGVVSLMTVEQPAPTTLPFMVRYGAFEWCLPGAATVQDALSKLLPDTRPTDVARTLARALDDIAAIAVRAGLLHPVFDPSALAEMPFRGSTTVVSDTSGVLQGGLDFVARYLHPAARVKVPTIVQMELVNSTYRFFSLRRSGNRSAKCLANELIEHLKSQGGQRVLLRLELRADTEIERTYLLGDPLRNAFQSDRDSDLAALNLPATIPAYVDRLILEAARHHQAQAGPNHVVRLLTSDQGLARMALGEGLSPLFFTAVTAASLFGERLIGHTFGPFGGEVQRTSLASVLWELATAFGSARLQNENGHVFSVSALGNGLSWWPYHSFEDLLWCEYRNESSDPSSAAMGEERNAAPQVVRDRRQGKRGNQSARTASFAIFDVGRMLRLISALDDNQEMTDAQVRELLGTGSRRGSDEYRRFLLSADLVSVDAGMWRVKPHMRALSAALRNHRIEDVLVVLRNSPSFGEFSRRVEQTPVGQVLDTSHIPRGARSYLTLGEITLLCAGPYPTPTAPKAAEFATMALARFAELDQGDGLVATGAWLEVLIRKDGIHPEIARDRLDEASARGYLHRSTEGSTSQVRFRDRIVHVLRVEAETPNVVPVYLYEGDYLIPGKGSVSLRIGERQNEST